MSTTISIDVNTPDAQDSLFFEIHKNEIVEAIRGLNFYLNDLERLEASLPPGDTKQALAVRIKTCTDFFVVLDEIRSGLIMDGELSHFPDEEIIAFENK